MSQRLIEYIGATVGSCSDEEQKELLKTKIKPNLAGLLKELLETFAKIEKAECRTISEVKLPGKDVYISDGNIKKYFKKKRIFSKYDPEKYVNMYVKSMGDASKLLHRIKEFENGIMFQGSGEMSYQGRISLTGKYTEI